MRADPDPSQDARPSRRGLPLAALLAWALFAFAIPRFVEPLNAADVLAFPLGFFMAAQGSLIAFLVIAVLSARRQERIDAAEAQEQ